MKLVLPGILESDWENIEKKLQLVLPFTNEVHIDLIDGKFVEKKTFFDPQPFKQYSEKMFLELHMMVDNPLQYLKPWADVGFKRFIGHIEKIEDVEEFIAEGQLLGEVGLAIDADTPLEKLTINISDVDCLLVMSVKAGLSGQEFMPSCLEKVKQLRAKTNIPIEVDGGITVDTLLQAAQAGANRFVSTSALFSDKNPKKSYEALHSTAEAHIQLPPVTSL